MDGGRSEEQDRDGAAGSGGGQAPPDVDDQFRSLLEGLRTTLPGVQLITAFLLTLPLYDSFADLDRDERVAYYIAFVTALLRSEEHTSELQSLMRNTYAVVCLKKK